MVLIANGHEWTRFSGGQKYSRAERWGWGGRGGLDDGSVRDAAVTWDDDDAVADVIEGVVHFGGFAFGGDHAVIPDAGVFIDDGIFDAGVASDTDAWAAF